MTATVVRATPAEARAHEGMYALHGWVVVDGQRCPVELPDGSRGDPKYEVLAPDGWMFEGGEHGLLCYDMPDLRERIKFAALTPTEN